jgi:hypothetical protein
MNVIRPEILACNECIDQEIQMGPSHWHRSHQIPGVDWCMVHKTILQRIGRDVDDPFGDAPHSWREKGRLSPVGACHPRLPDGGLIRRYADICLQLLSEPAPAYSNALKAAIVPRLEVAVSRFFSGPYSILARVPAGWSHPELDDLRDGTLLRKLKARTTVTGSAYALLLASTSRTTQEAVDTYHAAQVSRPSVHSVGDDFWYGGIWESYLAVGGNVMALHRLFGGSISRKCLYERLASAGLVGLKGLNANPRWDALLMFSDGANLDDACARYEIPRDTLESLLRVASGRLVAAIRSVRKERPNRG